MVAIEDRIHRIASTRSDRITRASRVRLLARQVAAGEYRVDPHALASTLIERALFHRGLRDELVAELAARNEA